MSKDIELSKGFFKDFCQGRVLSSIQPVLQILQIKAPQDETPSSGGHVSFKLQCSDGSLYYNHCVMDEALNSKVEKVQLIQPGTFPIIHVTRYLADTTSELQKIFVIENFEVLSMSREVIDKPKLKNVQGEAIIFKGKRTGKDIRSGPATGSSSKMPKKDDERIMKKISEINGKIQTRWKICGVVCHVDPVRTIETKKGAYINCGYFLMNDDSKKIIKITVMGEMATSILQQIHLFRCYYVSGAATCIQPSIEKYNTTGHPFEIAFNNFCIIESAPDCTHTPILLSLSPMSIQDAAEHIGETVDLLAVVDKIGALSSSNNKKNTGTILYRRNIHLVDQSSGIMYLTLWNERAVSCTFQSGDIIGLKNVVVHEYDGTTSLNLSSNTIILQVYEQLPEKEADALKAWYSEYRKVSHPATNFSVPYVFREDQFQDLSILTKKEVLKEMENQPFYFSMRCKILHISRQNLIYQACSNTSCYKSVSLNEDGTFFCSKCGTSSSDAKYLYRMQVQLAEDTWMVVFDEMGFKLLGVQAYEMAEKYKDRDPSYEEILQSKENKMYAMRCKATLHMDGEKVNLLLLDFEPYPDDDGTPGVEDVNEQLESQKL